MTQENTRTQNMGHFIRQMAWSLEKLMCLVIPLLGIDPMRNENVCPHAQKKKTLVHISS